MGLNKDQAIVLSTRPFGESDKIVKFFTLQSGKLTGIAKGGRKSQKRFMNTLEPFNRISLEYFEKPGSTMVRVENADVQEWNAGIEKSLVSVCVASFFSEFVDRLTREKECNDPLFHSLADLLVEIKRVEFDYIDILYYEFQLLGQLGFMPNFHTCVRCGRVLPEQEKLCFARDRGGVVCQACSRAVPHRRYPPGFIPRLSSLDRSGGAAEAGFEQLGREMLDDFIAFHLDVDFKSYRILKSAMKTRKDQR